MEEGEITKNKEMYERKGDLRFSQPWLWRMPSSGTWRCVDLVWTEVSEERRFTQNLHSATSQETAFFERKGGYEKGWEKNVKREWRVRKHKIGDRRRCKREWDYEVSRWEGEEDKVDGENKEATLVWGGFPEQCASGGYMLPAPSREQHWM
jgi:hypothetical protein